ncbi:hypothetical protein [Flavobacterium subsaxonicum]|uniref:Lipoprotein n=1 Tax=Flavobacterium subsaxonicum WB 4.1-42 = DSM 21790 TaxID=1121898 RepID=A0A0A2MBJ9_9FLAO|nr:hypothetical protein [Flavobacterium subsaxonicum]KGO90062.1 hypothetical protein Q766_21160 [Flavobacterium subsaxonicum WB 4.1-42 = DSM 21790]
MKKVYLLLFTVFALVSCDPPHDIIFKNNTDFKAKVILKIKDKAKSYDLGELVTGDSIVFNLIPETDDHIEFGIGTWSDKEIQLITSDLKSLTIKTHDKTVIYDNESQLKKLLTENRSSFPNTKINIEIEE